MDDLGHPVDQVSDLVTDELTSLALGFYFRPTDTPVIESIKEDIARHRMFTAVISRRRIRAVRRVELSLVFFKIEKLAFACLASPTIGGSTGHRKMRFYDLVHLDIETSAIVRRLSPGTLSDFDKLKFASVLRPTAALWNALWSIIKEINPSAINDLDRLLQRAQESTFDFSKDENGVYFQARDAIGVALEAAGISRQGVFSKFSSAFEGKTILGKGLTGGLTEDVVIHHDARNIPGFIRVEDQGDGFRFESNGRVLEVVIANRRPLEEATGADLVYFNHRFNAITFIQYKMMRREGETWVYRPDGQCRAEVDRMIEMRQEFFARGEAAATADAFRLHNDPFFFKLVKRDRIEMNSDEMTKGMYLSLSHFQRLMSEPAGERGGVLMSFESAIRWFCKTGFTSLLRDGWIGSAGVTPDDLQDLVDQRLESGRIVIAAQTSSEPLPA